MSRKLASVKKLCEKLSDIPLGKEYRTLQPDIYGRRDALSYDRKRCDVLIVAYNYFVKENDVFF